VTLPLVTKRLLIREFEAADLDGLTAVYGDPAVLWWEPEPLSRERTARALARILERYRSDGIAEYAVCLKDGGELIGDCGPVYREIEGERLPELGWDLRSDQWGHGYATEAARAVLTHAADIGLGRVYSLITPGNARSQGVARRLGMSVDRRVMWAGRPHDLWALAIA
jgi:RimJ/RimL family protein N-acetyltransferase